MHRRRRTRPCACGCAACRADRPTYQQAGPRELLQELQQVLRMRQREQGQCHPFYHRSPLQRRQPWYPTTFCFGGRAVEQVLGSQQPHQQQEREHLACARTCLASLSSHLWSPQQPPPSQQQRLHSHPPEPHSDCSCGHAYSPRQQRQHPRRRCQPRRRCVVDSAHC